MSEDLDKKSIARLRESEDSTQNRIHFERTFFNHNSLGFDKKLDQTLIKFQMMSQDLMLDTISKGMNKIFENLSNYENSIFEGFSDKLEMKIFENFSEEEVDGNEFINEKNASIKYMREINDKISTFGKIIEVADS